jgi:hypothetical protein
MSTDDTTPISTPPAQAQATPEQQVSYDRFSAVNEARREAEAQIAELRSQLEQVVPVLGQVEQLSQALQAERTERQTVEVLAQHGIGDSDLRDLVRWCYDRMPAEGRPAFGDAVAAWRGDPEAAPVALRPHLQAPQPSAPPMPNSNAGALRQPTANGSLNVSNMDLEMYRQHREAVLKTLGKG